jgi:GT2 family glycosyltransferase
MPHISGVLNALARLARGPRPGERLDPPRFLAHAAALAAKAPSPPRLWLSVLADGPQAGWPKGGPAEFIVRDPAERWSEALARARAPYVARLDLAGRLTPYAAERIAGALAAHPEAEGLYTDEAVAGVGGAAREIVLKPAFDPVLLDSFDYFGRLAVYRRERVAALGGWEQGDHELARRVAAEARPGAILHLPYPAYIGPPRAAEVTTPLGPPPGGWPKVSVVIPSRDSPTLIGAALAGLYERSDYPEFDVTVVDNGSTDPATLALYRRYAGPRFRVEMRAEPFNFSRAVNRGAALSDGPLVLLLNNDVEVVEPGWLKEMVSCLAYPRTGIVGAKLLYPDGTLQHAGVIAGLGGYAGHWHIGRPESEPGPQGRLAARQSLSVVTGACMLVSRACFEALGGFDEETFPIAYNDVDFCLRAGAGGWRVVWTPFARLVHHESASRGSDETAENRARFARDKSALQARHATDVYEDRAYNPWASRTHSDPWPMARADLPAARA